MKHFSTLILLSAMVAAPLLVLFPTPISAQAPEILFPVLGATRFSDDFGDPRTGHTHEGNDIFGVRGQPLIAPVDGIIRSAPYPQPSWGYSISIRGDDGYIYYFYHVNNDVPGTDNGLGGGMFAYAPDVESRNPVVAGQIIGSMGDSGNAEGTSPHLHFEIRLSDGTPINPFTALTQARHIDRAVIPPPLPDELLPFGEFRGGGRITMGDVLPYDGEETIVGAGPGGGPQIRIYDAEDQIRKQFFAFPTEFQGGIDVATGDIDADGVDEIIVGAGPGRDPTVRVFTADGVFITEFLAYPEFMRSGVNVAAADFGGDGITEIVTGPGPGSGPQVRVFRDDGTLIGQFFAYNDRFRGGVDVAAIPMTETSEATIIAGAGPGGGPHVRIFTPSGLVRGQFMSYDEAFRGGVRVDTGNIQEDTDTEEIVVSPASGGGPNFRIYNTQAELTGYFTREFEVWWRGGYDVAAGEDIFRVISHGGRRTSIRTPTD